MKTLAAGLPPGRRRRTTAALAGVGIIRSRLAARDVVREAALTVTRAPVRSVLTSLGTALAVTTAIATIGLADSASGAVSSTFNALRSTLVSFTDSDPNAGSQVLTTTSEQTMDRLNGVRSAGLIWTLGGGQLFNISRSMAAGSQASVGLPVTAASPSALGTIGVSITDGRTYDSGMERRGDPVALLGAPAARALGISSVDLSPVIYIDGTALTVIGIVASSTADNEALLGVLVPADLAGRIDPGDTTARSLLVWTDPGAAQLIGQQGPYALNPRDPGRITAEVPPDPTLLHNQVSSSFTRLLFAVALVVLAVGVVAIANTVLLSVIQRRPEIGLRRSVGATPLHIATMIVTEAAIIGLIGGTIGASLGLCVTAAVSAANGWVPVLDPRIMFAAPLAGAVSGLLAGAYPAWRASRVAPISALRG